MLKSMYDELSPVYQKLGLAGLISSLEYKLKETERISLNIAITGESGAGKSTLVNALRGVEDDSSEAARVGEVETTMKVLSFKSPRLSNVVFWDLPGVGTMKFPANDYPKKMDFGRFDFFLLVASERFKENDLKLANEVEKMGKLFYFVRSKIDNDVRQRRGRKPKSESEVLQRIRDDCQKNLDSAGLGKAQIFLLSGWDVQAYDFQKLLEALEKDVPEAKRNTFLLSLSSRSDHVIKQKARYLKRNVMKTALLLCMRSKPSLSPTPQGKFNLIAIMEQVALYQMQMETNQSTLISLSCQFDKPLEDFYSVMTCPPKSEEALRKLVEKRLMEAEEAIKGSNVESNPFTMFMSDPKAVHTITHALESLLDSFECDAKKILAIILQ